MPTSAPESPRRIAVAVVVSLALTAAAVPVVAALASLAFPAPSHHYQARVLCGKNGLPSRSCRLQEIPRAEFVDHSTMEKLHQLETFVNQTALGDFAITYEINVHCDAPIRMRALYSELHRNILDVFNEYGVQIMTPAYEGDPEIPKIVPKEQMYTSPARRPVEHEGV